MKFSQMFFLYSRYKRLWKRMRGKKEEEVLSTYEELSEPSSESRLTQEITKNKDTWPWEERFPAYKNEKKCALREWLWLFFYQQVFNFLNRKEKHIRSREAREMENIIHDMQHKHNVKDKALRKALQVSKPNQILWILTLLLRNANE